MRSQRNLVDAFGYHMLLFGHESLLRKATETVEGEAIDECEQ